MDRTATVGQVHDLLRRIQPAAVDSYFSRLTNRRGPRIDVKSMVDELTSYNMLVGLLKDEPLASMVTSRSLPTGEEPPESTSDPVASTESDASNDG
jgi:hypothetical protein